MNDASTLYKTSIQKHMLGTRRRRGGSSTIQLPSKRPRTDDLTGNDDEPGFENPNGPPTILDSPWLIFAPRDTTNWHHFYFIAWCQPHTSMPYARIICGYVLRNALYVLENKDLPCSFKISYDWKGKHTRHYNFQTAFHKHLVEERNFMFITQVVHDRIAEQMAAFAGEKVVEKSNRVDGIAPPYIQTLFKEWIQHSLHVSGTAAPCPMSPRTLHKCNEMREGHRLGYVVGSKKSFLKLRLLRPGSAGPGMLSIGPDETFMDALEDASIRPAGGTKLTRLYDITGMEPPFVVAKVVSNGNRIQLRSTPNHPVLFYEKEETRPMTSRTVLAAILLGPLLHHPFTWTDCMIYNWGHGDMRRREEGGRIEKRFFKKKYVLTSIVV